MALEPLKITCTSSDCENGLHCFKRSRKMAAHQSGHCRSCGVDLIDWDRVHIRNLNDAPHTFTALKTELIRHHYWHREIDEQAINHARRKGKAGIRVGAERRLRTSVGSAEPFRDGMQTPKQGNILYYAQHATATCCRKCIEYWHGIPRGRELGEDELAYLIELVILFVEERLPNLTESGEKIPTRRQRLVAATKRRQP